MEATGAYMKLFAVSQSADEKMSELESLGREVEQLFQHPVSLDKALAISRNMTRKEVSIKYQMRELLEDPEHQPFFTSEHKEVLERFVSRDWIYYTEPSLDSEAINLFVQAMNVFGAMVSKRAFEVKKSTLSRQLEVISPKTGKS